MVHAWHDISIGKKQPKIVNAIIEIPKGCTIKYELDKDSGLLKLDRYLYPAMYYPGDYGFLPQTYWEDGDPLDVFVLTHVPTQPLTLCEVKVLGVLRMIDDGEGDDKIIGVHATDPRYSEWNTIEDVPKHMIKELKDFLEHYKVLQGKKVTVTEILSAKAGEETVKKGIELYQKKFSK